MVISAFTVVDFFAMYPLPWNTLYAYCTGRDYDHPTIGGKGSLARATLRVVSNPRSRPPQSLSLSCSLPLSSQPSSAFTRWNRGRMISEKPSLRPVLLASMVLPTGFPRLHLRKSILALDQACEHTSPPCSRFRREASFLLWVLVGEVGRDGKRRGSNFLYGLEVVQGMGAVSAVAAERIRAGLKQQRLFVVCVGMQGSPVRRAERLSPRLYSRVLEACGGEGGGG